MDLQNLSSEFQPFRDRAVAALRRSYEVNASKFDPEVGDDAVVFGVGVYRNSWHLIETEVAYLDHWTAARPQGSLVITGGGYRIHVYRCGSVGSADDLHSFRLDEAASETKRLIAAANSGQMSLDFGGDEDEQEASFGNEAVDVSELRELVIIHAGNPDEGCRGVWVGAPVRAEDVTASPWAWLEPLWLPGEATGGGTAGVSNGGPSRPDSPVGTPHYQLPEPSIDLRPVPRPHREGTEEHR